MRRKGNVEALRARDIRRAFRNPQSMSSAMRELGLTPTNGADRRKLQDRLQELDIQPVFVRKRPRCASPATKQCLTCDKTFSTNSTRSIETRKYCSRDCYDQSRSLSKGERLGRRRARRRELRDSGRCVSCGGRSPGRFVTCKKCRDRHAEYRRRYPDKVRRSRQETQQKVKRQVIGHYGSACECCGERNLHFLTLDHVNNDGGEHRRLVKEETGAASIYRWIRNRDFDHDFELRVLCYNCNLGRRVTGVCPHQLSEEN